jgi:hypothetical protein
MAGKKYWDVMYTLRPSTSLQMPNIELHRPGIEPGPGPLNGVKKVLAPSKCPSIWLIKLLSHKKNYVPQFLKQRDINS